MRPVPHGRKRATVEPHGGESGGSAAAGMDTSAGDALKQLEEEVLVSLPLAQGAADWRSRRTSEREERAGARAEW